VDAVDHGVHRCHADRPGSHDRGVVADAEQDSCPLDRAAGELGGDGFDQGALSDARVQRCR